ncbi:MAG: hypothetical protein J4G05_12095 [Chlorobi bacterium]|nr:hypothetical protein [Chlorobiota bacterium]
MKGGQREGRREKMEGRWKLCLLPVILGFVFAQTSIAQPATPDIVVSVKFGEGGGRGEEHMPESLLGFPDSTARENVPTIDPAQVLSLGLGGEIILRFEQVVIVDGPGVDFTVFENAFIYRIGEKDRIYAEPAEVAVSRDGSVFTPFPFDSLSLEGCAGITPTFGDMDPGNPEASGGDGFDLAELGLDSIRFIRIRDVSEIVKGNSSHPFYDVTVNGFDLDAVVGIHTVRNGFVSDVEEDVFVESWPYSRGAKQLQLDLRAQ